MNIMTFGSRVIDDAIQNSNHCNRFRVRGISPFSFKCHEFEYELIPENEILINNSYLKKMIFIDVNKTLNEEINKRKYDYFILDLAEIYEPFYEIKLEDGRNIRLSSRLYEKDFINIICESISKRIGVQIENIKCINPMEWSSAKIASEIVWFCNWILRHIPKDKVILFDVTLPFHKEGKEQIEIIEEWTKVQEKNNFIRVVHQKIKSEIECKTIQSTGVSLGNEKCMSSDPSYTKSYYQYILNCLSDIEKKNTFDKSKEIFIKELQVEVDFLLIKGIIQNIKRQSGGRKIIYIGENESIISTIDIECGIKINAFIEYNQNTNLEEIEKKLHKLHGLFEEYYFLIPHLYNDGLLKMLYKMGFAKDKDVLVPTHDVIKLTNFKGEYYDIFHNKIFSEKETNFYILGLGAYASVGKSNNSIFAININMMDQTRVEIEEDVQADKLLVSARSSSVVKIGKESSFADNCRIILGDYMKVEIGDDCMFSSKIVVHAGDGHSIFNQETGEKTNNSPNIIDEAKGKIEFGKHVWVGYQVFVLPGTSVGSGSIIGARAVVNKKYPNNCIIAGNVAKIIKKDIGWTRDPFITDIYKAGLEDDYLKFTE